jgi:hypothetical protein
MTSPIDLIGLADALALVATIPDVVSPDGVKRIATAFENSRNGDNWRTQFPRKGLRKIGQEVSEVGLGPITFDPRQIAGQWVEMTHPDGRVFRFPAILIQALAGWTYVALERGDITPEPLPENA